MSPWRQTYLHLCLWRKNLFSTFAINGDMIVTKAIGVLIGPTEDQACDLGIFIATQPFITMADYLFMSVADTEIDME